MNRYFYWQRKLREAALMTAAAQNKTNVVMEINKPQARTLSNLPSGWALCETKESDRKDEPVIQIEIGKSRVTVHPGTDTEFLEKVCRTLMLLC